MVHSKGLFEHWTPADIVMISELPFPLFNDVFLKQIEQNKKEQARIEALKKNPTKKRKMK